MRRWRIYYGDGTMFSNEDGLPWVAPGLDVQAVVQPDPMVGRHVLSGFAYYWFEEDQWYGGDLFGLYDYLIRPGVKTVKFGRTIPNETFQAIYARALEDPDFPRKSGWRRDEIRPFRQAQGKP